MSWGHSCSIGPDVEEARFLSPMQPYKVTLSVLSRALPSGGLLTTAASSKLCGPTRTADSQLMHGFNTCHAGRDVGQLLVVCLGGTRWANSSCVLGWHKKRKCWRIVDMQGRGCAIVPHFIVSSVQGSSCTSTTAGRRHPLPKACRFYRVVGL